MTETTKKLLDILEQFDAKGSNNESWDTICKRVADIVEAGETLVFATFTCSTINAGKMFAADPWNYVSLDPAGNNLEPDIIRLKQILKKVQEVYPNVLLRILIGNTDPFYIYTQQFSALDTFLCEQELMERFAERWEAYRARFVAWLTEQLSDAPFEVVSWYAFEKIIEQEAGRNFVSEFTEVRERLRERTCPSYLAWELSQLRKQFAPGMYFDGLEMPEEILLKDWVERKFTEYAVQALWIRTFMANAFLIQNEKPSDLRTSMYQPLVQEMTGEPFPLLYFFGVDNKGYQ